MIEILQNCIDVAAWPLWAIALIALAAAIKECWITFTR